MRSNLWAKGAQVARNAIPSVAEIIHDRTGLGDPERQDAVEARYRTHLQVTLRACLSHLEVA